MRNRQELVNQTWRNVTSRVQRRTCRATERSNDNHYQKSDADEACALVAVFEDWRVRDCKSTEDQGKRSKEFVDKTVELVARSIARRERAQDGIGIFRHVIVRLETDPYDQLTNCSPD